MIGRLVRPASALALGVVVAMGGCSNGSSGERAPVPAASVGTQVSPPRPLPERVLNLPLQDQDGEAATLARWRGKVLVVSDAMTLCQETCSLDTANLVAAARAVQLAGLGDRVQFLTVTVDPARDTPARLAAYRNLFSPPPANWSLLTGTRDTIAALWTFLGIYYQEAPAREPAVDWLTGEQIVNYDVTHSDVVFFLDGSGRERFTISGVGHVAAGALPETLRRFLNEEGRRHLEQPDAQDWNVDQVLTAVSWLTNQPISREP